MRAGACLPPQPKASFHAAPIMVIIAMRTIRIDRHRRVGHAALPVSRTKNSCALFFHSRETRLSTPMGTARKTSSKWLSSDPYRAIRARLRPLLDHVHEATPSSTHASCLLQVSSPSRSISRSPPNHPAPLFRSTMKPARSRCRTRSERASGSSARLPQYKA